MVFEQRNYMVSHAIREDLSESLVKGQARDMKQESNMMVWRRGLQDLSWKSALETGNEMNTECAMKAG